MKINLAKWVMILSIFMIIGNYSSHHFGIDPENDFRNGAFFVAGIGMFLFSLITWKIVNPYFYEIEIFKKKKDIDRFRYS